MAWRSAVSKAPGCDPLPRLGGHEIHLVEQLGQALVRHRRGEAHGGVLEERQALVDLRHHVGLLHEPARDQIPLVHREDEGAPRLVGVSRDVRILRRHAFGGVEDEDGHVRALEALQRHHHGQLLERLRHLALSPDARRVDQDVRALAKRHGRVHGVARRARLRVHEDALVAEHGIHERGLADIGPPDDGHAHARTGNSPRR